MLAKLGEPFDSDDYVFEFKWDGMRVLAFVEHGTYRLVNRRQRDCTNLYPELDFLRLLPAGTVLDGELVVMDGGRPSFSTLMSRERTTNPARIRSASRSLPATLVAFDLLYAGFRSVMNETLLARQRLLRQTIERHCGPRLALSEPIVGQGKRLFQEVVARELEGVVAKRAASRYLPGKRGWVKFKRRCRMPCVVIGYVPEGRTDYQSLLLATNGNEGLELVGSVGNGFTAQLREHLIGLLQAQVCARPVVRCRERAVWVEPSIYCWVSYTERTRHGELRDPVFEELVA
jgi:DNA ligase D-like protein (predicted ligase)